MSKQYKERRKKSARGGCIPINKELADLLLPVAKRLIDDANNNEDG